LRDRAASPAGRRSSSWRCSPRARFPSDPGSHPAGGGGDGGAVLLRTAVTDLTDPENLDLERPQYDEDVEGEEYPQMRRARSHPHRITRSICARHHAQFVPGDGWNERRGSSAPAPPGGEPLLLLKGCASPPGGGNPYPFVCTGPKPDVEQAGEEKGQEQGQRTRAAGGPPWASFRISVIMHTPFPTIILLMSVSSSRRRATRSFALRALGFPAPPVPTDDRLAASPFKHRPFISRT